MNNNKFISMMEQCVFSYNSFQPLYPNEKLTFIDNKESDVFAVLRTSGNHLIITFRGSDTPKDWLTNFFLLKKTVPYANFNSEIRVHSGFVNAYKSVREQIQSYITEDIYYISVCGHSLGAALAVLCAVDLQYNFKDKDIEVYAFGCPRVGNLPFVRSYNKRVAKTFRIETKGDVVTKLPPSFLGYRHVGMGFKIPAVQYYNPHMPLIYLQSLVSELVFREAKNLPVYK